MLTADTLAGDMREYVLIVCRAQKEHARGKNKQHVSSEGKPDGKALQLRSVSTKARSSLGCHAMQF